MGRFFNDDVELALKHIFYDMRLGSADGQRGMELLTAAADQGDGDAAYFLSRCYAGSQFAWSQHHFPEDDDLVIELMRKSIALGSAVGVIGGMRTTGVMTPSVLKKMPFENLKEAWDIVYQKAQDGEAFCQYMIGNSYFWGDIGTVENKTPKAFAKESDYKKYLKDNLEKCIPWFEKAFANGVYFAGNNMNNLYDKGRGEFFSAQPEKVRVITQHGAELGYPNYQGYYADYLFEDGQYEEALFWYKKALSGGATGYLYNVGKMYEEGQGVEKDLAYALECYEECIKTDDSIGGYNGAGKLYYEGQIQGKRDYAKAIHYFEKARSLDNKWSNDRLANCYLHGFGCSPDYIYAKRLLDEVSWTSDLKKYCLGLIYADGLGVPENIKKGVSYLQEAASLPEAKQALLRFKKKMFGKWVRRN